MDAFKLMLELGDLRHDKLDHQEVKKRWGEFFAGRVPEFYLHTLEVILELGKEQYNYQLEDRAKLIKIMMERKQKEEIL